MGDAVQARLSKYAIKKSEYAHPLFTFHLLLCVILTLTGVQFYLLLLQLFSPSNPC